jgi:hypothetical protein
MKIRYKVNEDQVDGGYVTKVTKLFGGNSKLRSVQIRPTMLEVPVTKVEN